MTQGPGGSGVGRGNKLLARRACEHPRPLARVRPWVCKEAPGSCWSQEIPCCTAPPCRLPRREGPVHGHSRHGPGAPAPCLSGQGHQMKGHLHCPLSAASEAGLEEQPLRQARLASGALHSPTGDTSLRFPGNDCTVQSLATPLREPGGTRGELRGAQPVSWDCVVPPATCGGAQGCQHAEGDAPPPTLCCCPASGCDLRVSGPWSRACGPDRPGLCPT